jgi:hypothetical protein
VRWHTVRKSSNSVGVAFGQIWSVRTANWSGLSLATNPDELLGFCGRFIGLFFQFEFQQIIQSQMLKRSRHACGYACALWASLLQHAVNVFTYAQLNHFTFGWYVLF